MIKSKTKIKNGNRINKKLNKTKKIVKDINKSKVFHFYDDHLGNMQGITFNKDETKIENIMCTDNIICHKIPKPFDETISKKKYNFLLNKYISKISNKNIANYIKLATLDNSIVFNPNKNIYNSFYDTECGLTNDQMHFLLNPNLKNIIVGFDMDSTLHQTSGFINKPINIFIKRLSEITKSKITINDIGEYYFGGKKRLEKIKKIFQNLNKTIGMQNVYIITSNPATLLPEILPYFYSKLFNVKFKKENVKVTIPKKLNKHEIILKIMEN